MKRKMVQLSHNGKRMFVNMLTLLLLPQMVNKTIQTPVPQRAPFIMNTSPTVISKNTVRLPGR